MKKRLAFALLLALGIILARAPHPVFAEGEEDIFVTEVLMDGDTASITLNDALQVREVKLLKTEGRGTLRLPEYVSKNGKVYPQVTVLSKQAYDAIVKAIETGKPSAEKAKSIKFRVADPHLLRSPSRLANVDITFNDAVTVTVGVLKSKRAGSDPYWLGYPSRRPEGGGKYINQVVVSNPKLKKAVEQAVLEKFQRALSEQGAPDAGEMN